MLDYNKRNILDSVMVEKDSELRLYQAPFKWGRSRGKIEWLGEEKPFFEREIYHFWKIYSDSSDGKTIELPVLEGIDERRDFIRKPLIIALNKGKTVGGVWVRSETKKNKVLGCFMHFKLLRENRGMAKNLLDYTLEHLKEKYPCVSCSWGYREPEENPTKFFERNGFIVQGNCEKGTAYKNLSK